MIYSMTGFGRGEVADEQYKITVEMKSVNHRYLDLSVRVPRKLGFLEAAVRNRIKDSLNRGKVDVFINLESAEQTNTSIQYNKENARNYYNVLCQIAKDFDIPENMTVCDIAHFPEVITVTEMEVDEEQITSLVVQAVEKALDACLLSRRLEGEKLRSDILTKIDLLEETVIAIETRSPDVIEEHRQKLRQKVTELLSDGTLDEGILATELVVYADKICVDEETVRLKTHFAHIRKTLNEDESIGRKLDFITQEMNREANTILSKSGDISISDCGIQLKTEIEKIREQIQNIE